MNEHYELKICGLIRNLKKSSCPKPVIASFVMLGDTQMIEKALTPSSIR